MTATDRASGDHLAEALRLLEWAGEPGHTAEQTADEPAALTEALVHAVLEVGEHVENLWDQVRRLADFAEGALELLRTRLVEPDVDAEIVDDEPTGGPA